jgi:hypothetical protein
MNVESSNKERNELMQEKESIPHQVEQHESQEGQVALEECTLPSTTTTSDSSILKKQNDSTKKESSTMMDYGHLSHDHHRHQNGGCSSSKYACVSRKILMGVEQEEDYS